MRVLHIATRLTPGGAPRNIIATLEWELRNGHDVALAIGPGATPALPGGLVVRRIPTLKRAVAATSDTRAYLDLARYIRGNSFDLVHTHYSKAGILGRLAARPAPGVVAHTIHMASFGPGYSVPDSFVFRLAERYCARFTDLFVAVGDELRRAYLAAGIGSANQYRVIPSPLELERFLAVRQMTGPELSRVRAKHGISDAVQVIVAAGLLERRKRFDLIIEKLAPLLRTRRFTLILAGEGPERQRLTTLAAKLGVAGQVRLVGYVDNLPELFGCSDVLVHSSRVEGMPQVVVQAAAAGLPVVASSVLGLSDLPPKTVQVVDKDGEGLLAACREVLASGGRNLIPVDVFQAWRVAHIEAQQVSFHEAVTQMIPRRPGGTR